MVSNITKNQRYSTLYFPDENLKDEFVDLELISTFSRESFLKLHADKKVHRIASLTIVGYYMFICKLTVFFLPPEDVEVNAARDFFE